MLLSTPNLAARLEATEAANLKAQVQAYRSLRPESHARSLDIAGGVAAFTDPAFGRKLNHVTGLGMNDPVTPGELRRIEQLYHPHGLSAEIDVCPHAEGGLLDTLRREGYAANAFFCMYAREITGRDASVPQESSLSVQAVDEAQHEAFVRASVAGFAAQPRSRPAELLRVLAEIARERQDSLAFVALVQGQVAGTAGVAFLPTPYGLTAFLTTASTLPEYRGRGVQGVLLRARLLAAHEAGAKLACLTTRVGNTSARNAQRHGFHLAYTKTTFSKPPPAPTASPASGTLV